MAEMKAIILKYALILGFLVLLTSCLEKRDVMDISTHPSGWMDKRSEQFHGLAVTTNESKSESCQTCHGEDYSGGTSGVSCSNSQCHLGYPHPQGFTDVNSPDSHIQFIRNAIHWDITQCKSCHGVDYAGEGSYDKNCLKCHTKKDGPENCTVCHGSTNAAPPADLSGSTETYNVTVGAHQAHVTGTRYTTNMLGKCSTCHNDVPVFNVKSHVRDGSAHAEVIFSDLGENFQTDDASWNRSSATCANVYCHGAFEFKAHDNNFAFDDSVMVGEYRTMTWTSLGSNQAVCGTCHGLPPEGHIASTVHECTNCHANVVDSNLNIVGKDLHMNGRVDH